MLEAGAGRAGGNTIAGFHNPSPGSCFCLTFAAFKDILIVNDLNPLQGT